MVLGNKKGSVGVGTGKASDTPAWMQDLENTPERVGRGQDKEQIMGQLRALGYMQAFPGALTRENFVQLLISSPNRTPFNSTWIGSAEVDPRKPEAKRTLEVVIADGKGNNRGVGQAVVYLSPTFSFVSGSKYAPTVCTCEYVPAGVDGKSPNDGIC